MLLLDWSLSVFNMFCAFNVCQWKRNAIHKMKAKKWMGLQIWLDLTMSEREKQYPSTNCGQKHKRNWYVCNMGLSIYETEFTQMPSSTRIICNMQWFFWQKKKEKLFLNICSSCICVWKRKCIWESERGKTSFPEMISLQEKGKLNETHCRYHSLLIWWLTTLYLPLSSSWLASSILSSTSSLWSWSWWFPQLWVLGK